MAESNSQKWVSVVLAVAIVIASIFLYMRIQGVSSEVAALQASLQKDTAALRNENAAARDAAAKQVDSLRAELQSVRTEAADGAQKASGEARRQAALVAKQLGEQGARQQQEVASQISEVKESALSANAKIADVSKDVTGVKSDVSSVRSEVASTRSELQKTISEMKRMNGDMGVMSGLIATNSKELAALKELGDRNYFSFNIEKGKQAQRIGDVQITLKKADTKRFRYSIDVLTEDRKVEKKDKGVNEPVQFYATAQARQPYEIVVNEVQKDRIVGYLATPKATLQRK